jgi:hypothetical protein
LIKKFLEEKETFSIEEVSLNKAAKLLKLGDSSLIDQVQKGNLEARTYRDKNRKKYYRFRLADVREFQDAKKFNPGEVETIELEPSKDLAKRIFRKKNNIRSCG